MDENTRSQIYDKMLLSRALDERIQMLFKDGELYGTTHLSIGQEASGVGAVSALAPDDILFSNHRNHAHSIARGMDIKTIMCELFGKECGCCGGRGGSMHLLDASLGYFGANGVVGGSVPLATGAALALKQRGQKRVVMCVFGDGATNQGAFHESYNMAAIWGLPIVFVCENNKYALSCPIERGMCVDIGTRSGGYGIDTLTVDGNDVETVYGAVSAARQSALSGMPSLVVCDTYRLCGHSKSDTGEKYRSVREVENARSREPLRVLRWIMGDEVFDKRMAKARQTIADAVEYARNAPDPTRDDLYRDIYAKEGAVI